MTTTHAPDHVTTIDQHRGDHEPTGLPFMELTEIRTSFADYSQDRWEDLSDDDREYWEDTLARIHEARVELEGLDDSTRHAAKEILGALSCDHPDDVPALIRQAIAEAETE